MLAIHANDAWGKGYRGKGATVAVLDEGFPVEIYILKFPAIAMFHL